MKYTTIALTVLFGATASTFLSEYRAAPYATSTVSGHPAGGSDAPSSSLRHRLSSQGHKWIDSGAGPLCGVYAACVALKLVGVDRSPADFVTSRYVGAFSGSTPDEVAAIVKSGPADAEVISGLSALDLRLLNCPLIANVRATPGSSRYDHWAVARYVNGEIALYDGVGAPTNLSVAEFLGIWSGLGIAVSKSGAPVLPWVWLGRILVLQTGVVIAFASRTLIFSRTGSGGGVFTRDTTAIFVGSCLLAFVGSLVFGDPVHNVSGVRIATAPFVSHLYKHDASLETLHAASKNDRCLLIDARRERDFDDGSIDGAINIPVYASLWAVREFLSDVDRHIPIVVFCQSESCPYDEAVASNLCLLGFRDVSVCSKGWVEYKKHFVAGRGEGAYRVCCRWCAQRSEPCRSRTSGALKSHITGPTMSSKRQREGPAQMQRNRVQWCQYCRRLFYESRSV